MEYPQAAIDALKQDFDTALVRLDSAVALGERKGVTVDDKSYAPAGRAHYGREQAVGGAVVAVLPVARRALDRSRTRRKASGEGASFGRGRVGFWVFGSLSALLVASALAAENRPRSEWERDALWRRDSIAESNAQFGLLTGGERRWGDENPTGHNVDPAGERGLIDMLSSSLWADRGLSKGYGTRLSRRTLSPPLRRAYQEMKAGHHDAAYRRLVYLAKWANYASYRQLGQIHDLMGQLAAAYVEMGDLERAARLYEEMLLVGRRLAPEHTGAALNRLIASHFERGEYETALMYVRVGIAVLDDVGIGPYRVMNRIIAEMSNPESAVGALEQDFDAALLRLESAVARGEDQGLVVEDQWWVPVYRARHDREEAIRILRTMLAPMRDDSGDILREDTEHEELTP